MWALDVVNSPELLDELQPHHPSELMVLWVGEGWRDVVRECHRELVQAFPDYELIVVKQKWGGLSFQARPRPRSATAAPPTDDEQSRCWRITDDFYERSLHVCEWCGQPGELREERSYNVTLCDDCDQRFGDPPRV